VLREHNSHGDLACTVSLVFWRRLLVFGITTPITGLARLLRER
jgi:hypothetical protein